MFAKILNEDLCSPLQIDESKFDHVMNINVKAPFFLTQMCTKPMAERGGGSIIQISTMASEFPNVVRKITHCHGSFV